MVDHQVESGCPQKAMLWASADNTQGVDIFSTPKIAPATPMQAWKKPAHRQESPDILPSLSLGRSSADANAAHVNSITPHSVLLPGSVSASVPSRLLSRMEHKESLLSFSLSKYKKNFDLATPLRNHMGPSSSHRVCAPAGDSATPHTGRVLCAHPDQISVSLGVADESSLHSSSPTSKSEGAASNAERICAADNSALLYSRIPGEVANDAYKLYSELFPSTSGAPSATLSNPMRRDVYQCSFLGPFDNKTPSPSEICGLKTLAQARCAHIQDCPGGVKKLKLSTDEEGGPLKCFSNVKQEPVSEESCGLNESSNCGEARSAGALHPKRKADAGSCKGDARKDLACAKPLLNASGVLGDCPIDVKPDIAAFKFSTGESLPRASSINMPTGGASEPLAFKMGAWESPVQGNPSVDTDWGKFLALSATPLQKTGSEILLPFQQRFKNLQAFLKECDEGDQDERLQGLRALPAASRSGYAVELETRAIRLSLEEEEELQRMRFLNVLSRTPDNSFDELGGTPHGPRLPVLGVNSPLTHVP